MKTSQGGIVEMDMQTADYHYIPAIDKNNYSETLTYVISDKDGDTIPSSQTWHITGVVNDFYTPHFTTTSTSNTLLDTIDGDTGYDTIVLNSSPYTVNGVTAYNGNYDLSTFTSKIKNVEEINIDQSKRTTDPVQLTQTVTIKPTDLLSITDSNHKLFINGDSSDTVDQNGFTQQATSNQAGYTMWTASVNGGTTVTLYIDTQITKII